MNKKVIALLLVMLLLLTGCKAKNNPADATDAPEAAATQENIPTETLHPALAENPFGDDWTEPTVEETQAEATEEPKETEAPKATEAPKETEAPTEPADKPTEAPESSSMSEYEKYMSLSAQEQSDYMNSFESVDAFFAWYNAAKEAHDSKSNEIEIGDGSFDLGELEGND